jgi:hypothetical protein
MDAADDLVVGLLGLSQLADCGLLGRVAEARRAVDRDGNVLDIL